MIPTSFSVDLTYGGGLVGAGSGLGWKLSRGRAFLMTKPASRTGNTDYACRRAGSRGSPPSCQ
eukprot:5727624-Prymnesium_polylepis.1